MHHTCDSKCVCWSRRQHPSLTMLLWLYASDSENKLITGALPYLNASTAFVIWPSAGAPPVSGHCQRMLPKCRCTACNICMPLPLLPSILPVTQSFSSFLSQITCPKKLICPNFMFLIISLLIPALYNTLSLDACSTQDIRCILLMNQMSPASIFFCITLLIFQASHPYSNVGHT